MALENSAKSCDQTNSWSDLDAFVAIPRLGGLVLSPDGKRLLVSLSSLDGDKTGYQSAWWSIDPDAAEPSRRLTRSVEGESSAAFLPDSSLLFTSKRATPPNHDPEADEDADSVQVLWCLPAGSGEAYVVGRREGGWSGILTATASERITLRVPMHRGTNDEQQDAAKRKLRKKNKISAILHESYPIRFWDHDLGPVADRLACGDLVADGADRMLQSTPLTGDIGRALDDAGWSVSADGTRLVIDWSVPRPGGEIAGTIVSIDTATGDRVTIAEDSADEFAGPVISADGSLVACMRVAESTATAAPDTKLWLITAEGSQLLAPDWDRWPQPIAFSPDNQTLYVVADDQGNGPIFAVDIDSGNVRRLTEDGAYSSVLLSADGSSLYAIRASYTDPGTIVAIDTASGKIRELAGPVSYQALPGRLENVETLAADGATIRGYLLLPDGASAANPAPLALMIHGGPLGSSNCWSWRWCPWLLVSQGWAVLLPDPALSTGYGLDFINRAWSDWGGAAYTDLMAITDAVEQRTDIDAAKTVAMGGSFGGYMANWIAGNTDRFRAIVTHASLWNLETFGNVTDAAWYWAKEMSPQARAKNSPHLKADGITTPMLVIHGDRDYRVPIGEGIALWWEPMSVTTATLRNFRTSSCTSPTRTTGSSPRSMRRFGTKRCARSSIITSLGGNFERPESL